MVGGVILAFTVLQTQSGQPLHWSPVRKYHTETFGERKNSTEPTTTTAAIARVMAMERSPEPARYNSMSFSRNFWKAVFPGRRRGRAGGRSGAAVDTRRPPAREGGAGAGHGRPSRVVYQGRLQETPPVWILLRSFTGS